MQNLMKMLVQNLEVESVVSEDVMNPNYIVLQVSKQVLAAYYDDSG